MNSEYMYRLDLFNGTPVHQTGTDCVYNDVARHYWVTRHLFVLAVKGLSVYHTCGLLGQCPRGFVG